MQVSSLLYYHSSSSTFFSGYPTHCSGSLARSVGPDRSMLSAHNMDLWGERFQGILVIVLMGASFRDHRTSADTKGGYCACTPELSCLPLPRIRAQRNLTYMKPELSFDTSCPLPKRGMWSLSPYPVRMAIIPPDSPCPYLGLRAEACPTERKGTSRAENHSLLQLGDQYSKLGWVNTASLFKSHMPISSSSLWMWRVLGLGWT